MPEITHEELLARIGQAYYLDNHSKVEIANEHGISRFQVARFLDEARAEGIVHIEIRRPGAAVEVDAPARFEKNWKPSKRAASLSSSSRRDERSASGRRARPPNPNKPSAAVKESRPASFRKPPFNNAETFDRGWPRAAAS